MKLVIIFRVKSCKTWRSFSLGSC